MRAMGILEGDYRTVPRSKRNEFLDTSLKILQQGEIL